ncbi:hypothetical protein GV794_01945 [Nocardia cyriacigeorgica]|uniref:Rho termination factor N-terminal domain-containing protein n=1 Tax=Nocardia cyriacigeorgica TaxID=135487 RepID=A0ABX0CCY8_9NOCA|nr:hypothetical protein [Nocardia cyriacigeorgica]NEW40785.1 hypothetical protein [Nocardia cyriacigeorgica]NEW50989.1 hypothetical protein [Nocardia cyriacigeorgica]NEW54428.1 hypothetical protein [Nocardia cyriacigeorgica]
MAIRKLAGYVHVHDPDGVSHVFGPDDDVPAELAKLITNPAAWAAPEPTDVPDDEPSDAWTVADLRAYADLHGIDLGEATKKADILAAIKGDDNA